MAQQLWYLTKNGQQFGPFTQQQLQEMMATGQLQPNDFIWTDGLQQWIAAASLNSFVAVSPQPDPEPQPEPDDAGLSLVVQPTASLPTGQEHLQRCMKKAHLNAA